ncbi:hypothetical protein [uncultured Sphaerochaeta sp.]|uniref:hypothetical protein n=1 Tax=uncultured Sphaerochaeta sp. TaxID=886478 RepID=UPI002A0A43A6|nr:hypothetical protein [uncultured Sphaerochaeta sp.]
MIDRSTAMRLARYNSKAEAARQEALDQIDLRFTYASRLASLLGSTEVSEKTISAIASYHKDDTVENLSAAYDKLDEALSELQKEIFISPDYVFYDPYFDKMYECETNLVRAVENYNEETNFFNQQRNAFPARLIASRLGLTPLAPFALSNSLKGRP